MENWSVAREVHIVVVTAEAMEAMTTGHAVSSSVASSAFVVGDAGIVELERFVGTPFVGKENASSDKVKDWAHRAAKRDMAEKIGDSDRM